MPSKPTLYETESPDYVSLLAEIASCKAQIQTLSQLHAIEHVIINGATLVSEEMRSMGGALKALAPRIRTMPETPKMKLSAIHFMLERPNYGEWPRELSKTPDRRTKSSRRKTAAQSGEYSA
jgi:hypothetical protein